MIPSTLRTGDQSQRNRPIRPSVTEKFGNIPFVPPTLPSNDDSLVWNSYVKGKPMRH